LDLPPFPCASLSYLLPLDTSFAGFYTIKCGHASKPKKTIAEQFTASFY
jgi:hypothetical protein